MEFVSCDLTGKLKKKGFPVKTKVEGKFGLTEMKVVDIQPTISQVLEWIREEHDIDIEVLTYHTFAIARRRAYAARIVTLNIDETLNRIEDTEMHIKWSDAAVWAIEYVVNNMII
jgi:hypothetical protein